MDHSELRNAEGMDQFQNGRMDQSDMKGHGKECDHSKMAGMDHFKHAAWTIRRWRQ